MSTSKSIEIPIQCPKCRHTIKKTLAELGAKHQITCRCGTVINVDPAGFKSVAKSIADLQKTISKLEK